MPSEAEKIFKSTQEQAFASWISYLNQIRLNELFNNLNQQEINFKEALNELVELKKFIGNPEHILGNPYTKHGEIAEHVQVNISNARNLIKGLEKEYTFDGVGRTAPEDYLFNGKQVQSKFCNGSKNTLKAVKEHLAKYPGFLKNGGRYDIPKDQYDEIARILELEKVNPSKLCRSDLELIKMVKDFKKESGLDFNKDINASVKSYNDVQQGKINKTIREEEINIKKEDLERKENIYNDSKPSLNEMGKTAIIGAFADGGISFCMAIASKRKEGKKLCEFTEQDWKEIFTKTGTNTVKGGIRGSAIYALTNFTATPANVASSYVTAVFGVLSQAKAYENGKISKEDFLVNSEAVCMDVTVSAIASLAGQVIIPIPVLGSVIGNIAGEFIYGICKRRSDDKENLIISGYRKQMNELNQQLNRKYLSVVIEIRKSLEKFTDLEKLAFDLDVNKAFNSSVLLAREIGVNESKILKTETDIDGYFLL